MSRHLLEKFLSELAAPLIADQLFAQVPDILFCIKDKGGKYLCANDAFADKLNLKSTSDIVGKTASELFPDYLAEIYQSQDSDILESGNPMLDRLEMITNKHGKLGWHIASKFPLISKNQQIIGIASISRDLQMPCDDDLHFAGLTHIISHIQTHYGSTINAHQLAKDAGLTMKQLDGRMRKIFKLTTAQFIRKTRITAASNLLRNSTMSVAQIAQECGYGDQSAFTRQFHATVGITPVAYRE